MQGDMQGFGPLRVLGGFFRGAMGWLRGPVQKQMF